MQIQSFNSSGIPDTVDVNSQDEELFFNGLNKANAEEYAAAMEDYNNALKINPNYPAVYYYRAIVKEKLGDVVGALMDRKKAKDLGYTE